MRKLGYSGPTDFWFNFQIAMIENWGTKFLRLQVVTIFEAIENSGTTVFQRSRDLVDRYRYLLEALIELFLWRSVMARPPSGRHIWVPELTACAPRGTPRNVRGLAQKPVKLPPRNDAHTPRRRRQQSLKFHPQCN